MLNRNLSLGALLLGVAGLAGAQSTTGSGHTALIVTASNTAANQLMIYSAKGALLKQIPTQGQGGVGGNSGGIAQDRSRLAVVNFGSGSVSVFTKTIEHANLRFESVISTSGSPVSVAFGHDHLYVLTTTNVESHALSSAGVNPSADGAVHLLLGDGSAAQVGVLPSQVIITEKTGVIETVYLNDRSAVAGSARLVANGLNAPFGLVTRGNDAYVSIAHSNEISLVRNNQILTETSSGQQMAPCWVAIDGPFLFSANSPSHSVSRFVIHGKVITLDDQVVAQFNGNPTDIDYRAGLAAVVDANGAISHVSIFGVDEDGNFTLNGVATIDAAATNGIAIVGTDTEFSR